MNIHMVTVLSWDTHLVNVMEMLMLYFETVKNGINKETNICSICELYRLFCRDIVHRLFCRDIVHTYCKYLFLY